MQLALAVAAEVGDALAGRDLGDGCAAVGAGLALHDSFVLASAARNACILAINGLNSVSLSGGAGLLLFR